MSSTSTKSTAAAAQTSLPTCLEVTGDDQHLNMPSLGQFKAYCLVLGFLIGTFIYLSTLGVKFIAVTTLWGQDILTKTNSELMFLSLAGNLATICIALVVVTCIWRLMAFFFLHGVGHSQSKENAEDILAKLLSSLQGHVVVGALVGICVAWSIVNLALGTRPQIFQSCTIMAVACLWGRVTLMILGKQEDALISDGSSSNQKVMEQPKRYINLNDQDDNMTEPLLHTV